MATKTGIPLNELGAVEIVDGIRQSLFTAEDVVRACLAHIATRDDKVLAWTEVDAENAVTTARGLARPSGGPLAGLPFAVKDVLDTQSLHTQMGSPLYEGHQACFDAGVVAQMRMAGAILLGKTRTCEFAGVQPTETVNPLGPAHTPGGSSSGSAAAVADRMVPFAFGTQTAGSVLRPASFCGIVGFKPTYSFYTIAGMKPAAHSFDTIGLLARSVGDIALVHRVLMDMKAIPTSHDSAPRIGLFRSHLWDSLDHDAARTFERTVEQLEAAGATIVEIASPDGFESITESRAVINGFERARGLAGEWMDGRDRMGPLTRGICERGFNISGEDYIAARRKVEAFREKAAGMLEGADFLITPTTPGEAPAGHEKTGDPRLQEIWTMLHMPSISIPAFKGRNGLPLGIQLRRPTFRG